MPLAEVGLLETDAERLDGTLECRATTDDEPTW
jgi:hypothetical protein